MLRRDYILRLVDEAVRAVHLALGLAREQEHAAALQTLDDTMQATFGWRSELLNVLPVPMVVERLSQGNVVDADGLLVLAVLVRAEGAVYEQQGASGHSHHRLVRALDLFLEAQRHGAGPALLAQLDETQALLDKLAPYELPEATLQRLFLFHEQKGAYAKAEDVLYRLLERAPRTTLHAEASAFYQRLLALPDEALRQGGLPRAEIEAGLSELSRTAPGPGDGA